MNALRAITFALITTTLASMSAPVHNYESNKPCILLDWGDTLFRTSKSTMMRNMGLGNLVCYFLSNACTTGTGINKRLQNKLFEFLSTIPVDYRYKVVVRDQHGHPIPPIMQAWLVGDMTTAHIRARVIEALYAQRTLFSGKRERRLIRNICNTIFTPELFAKSRTLIPARWKLIKDLKQCGCRIIVLSNWDPESFLCMKQRYSQLHNIIDDYVISGSIGLAKPDPAIFHYLLEQYNLNATQCVLLDDQTENLVAAQQIGIHAIATPLKKNDTEIRQALQTWLDGFESLRCIEDTAGALC